MSATIQVLDRYFHIQRKCLICNTEFIERDNLGSLSCSYGLPDGSIVKCDHISSNMFGYISKTMAEAKELNKKSSFVILDENNNEIHMKTFWHTTPEATLSDPTWNLSFIPLAYLPDLKFRHYDKIIHITVGYDIDDAMTCDQQRFLQVSYPYSLNYYKTCRIDCSLLYSKYLMHLYYNDEFRNLLNSNSYQLEEEIKACQSVNPTSSFAQFTLSKFVSNSNHWNGDEFAFFQTGSVNAGFGGAGYDNGGKFYVPVAVIPRIEHMVQKM